jgi:hypothetical protein
VLGGWPCTLRVVREGKLGLQGARERGLQEAKYYFLGFVDDDNWVARDWVRIAHEALASDASTGAVGSVCDPVFEVAASEWFDEFHSNYAVLTDADLRKLRRTLTVNGRPPAIESGYRANTTARCAMEGIKAYSFRISSATLASWRRCGRRIV